MKKLGFGLMRLPLLDSEDSRSIDIEQCKKMTDLFLEKGFTYFDTAYMYHKYSSEKAVKEFLTSRHPRDSYTLTTKLPAHHNFLKTEEDNERIFNEQLEKTGVDYFDYYLYHNLNVKNYENITKLNSFAFVDRMKKEGKVKNIAFSFHDTADVLDKILTEHPEVDFVQLQINYLDWESPSIQSRLCYETAVKHGKRVIVMEPVKGGMLQRIPKEAVDLMKAYNKDASPASWAIRFAAGLENVYMVLSGMSNMEQMEDNLSYMENFQPLNDEEMEIIKKVTKIINDKVEIPCTDCKYCVEGCPQNINIPGLFETYNEKCQFDLDNKRSYEAYTKDKGKASDCIECGACEGSCPQSIPIIDELKKIAKVYE
ncbi:MAG: 4Fe-4S dicluster domain-containing protein [Tissierellia bacterium]|nr:4Fe-4S dicluster domain-containing protein [Tissierellia bacterium]